MHKHVVMDEADLVPYVPTSVIEARRVLVLAPHPDDEVFGCGGAIAAHLHAGAEVRVVVLTDGHVHGDANDRAAESRAAAEVLGYGEPEFWHETDRALLATSALCKKLSDCIAAWHADLVYAPSPWEIHPDHRQTAWLAVQVVQALEEHGRLAFYEVGAPLRPNVLVDITPHASTKFKAMSCFASQMLHQDYSLKMVALNQYRTYTLPNTVKAAEAFLLLHSHELASFMQSLGAVAFGGTPAGVARSAEPIVLSVVLDLSHPEALPRALDTLALQTWPRLEVLVRAPPDQCVTGHAHAWPFPVGFVTDHASGSKAQTELAVLDQCSGSYVFFMGEGDHLPPDHLAKLVHTLTACPQLSACSAELALTRLPIIPSGSSSLRGFLVRHAAANRELQFGHVSKDIYVHDQLAQARFQMVGRLSNRNWRLTRPLQALNRLLRKLLEI